MNNYIIDAFKNLGKPQKEIIADLGKPQSFVSALMNGKKSVGKNLAKQLHELYGFDVASMLTGQGVAAKPQTYYGGESFEPPIYVPLLPISAKGGSLNDFTISVKDSDCEKIISPIKGADFAITVSGDSMSPEYPSGSKILIKKINEKAFIEWNRCYVLDTCNGTVIKKLMPSENEGKVKCVSINPDYPDFEISLNENEVFGVYRVLLLLTEK